MTEDKVVEVINVDSDEDEDVPRVQHKPQGNVMHAPRDNLHIERSESASPSILQAQGGISRDVRLEQCKPAPATTNRVLQPELRQPAPSMMNGVLPHEQREPAPPAMNGVLHPEQCKPACATRDGVSPQANLWYYVDPQGDTRGPFPLLLLFHWKKSGFFDQDFRVWRTGHKAILLTDAFQMHL
ncbi:unnamed protein product [Urochloa humidicola]